MSIKGKGILLASAAALLLTSQAFSADSNTQQAKPVKCFGVNSCRGKGQCGEKNRNACAGQNSCKGKGWIFMSADECKSKGGAPSK